MSIMRPNLMQQENSMRGVPDEALRELLLRMGQNNEVGTPKYLLAAGEMLARKNVRQQAAMGRPSQPPVIAELLAGGAGAMPPQGMQQPMPPQEAGVAGLPAPNMENFDEPEYAEGGVVGFQAGGSTSNPYSRFTGTADPRSNLIQYTAEEIEEQKRLKEAGLLESLQYLKGRFYDPVRDAFTKDPRSAGGPRAREIIPETKSGIAQAEAALAKQAEEIQAGKGPNETAAKAGLPAIKVPSAAILGKAPSGKDAPGGKGPSVPGIGGLPSLARSSSEIDEMYKQAGVSMDPYADYKKALAAEEAQMAGDRTQAGWMRALEAGLGIAGGTSPYALVNIGQGAQSAAKGALEDTKEFKKLDRERNKALASVAVAENDLKRGVTDKKIDRYDRAMERYQTAQLKMTEITAGKEDRRMGQALTLAQSAWKNLSDAEKLTGGPGGKPLSEEEFIQKRALQYLPFLQKGEFGMPTAPKVDTSQWGNPRIKQ